MIKVNETNEKNTLFPIVVEVWAPLIYINQGIRVLMLEYICILPMHHHIVFVVVFFFHFFIVAVVNRYTHSFSFLFSCRCRSLGNLLWPNDDDDHHQTDYYRINSSININSTH